MRRRVIGPRTAVEAAFLVAVPIVVGVVLGAEIWTIVAASAVAYLLIVLVEAFLWYEGRREPGEAAPRRMFRSPRSVIVRGQEDDEAPAEPAPQEEPAAAPEPVAAAPVPEPAAEPAPTPARKAFDHVRVLRRDAEPEPEPERAPLVAVPAPESEPALAEAPAPAASSTVVPIGVGAAPQRWNLWDLERLSREHTGTDPARDEERTFLLMYLREFADADGMLPMDFDGLVRDSFGDLVTAR
jgi:hypothetical protein